MLNGYGPAECIGFKVIPQQIGKYERKENSGSVYQQNEPAGQRMVLENLYCFIFKSVDHSKIK
jgi:hypothetical protein